MGSKVPKSVVEEYEKGIDYYSKNINGFDEEKPVWALGLFTGVFGIVYFLNRFWPFIK
jgi:hypothetical protein